MAARHGPPTGRGGRAGRRRPPGQGLSRNSRRDSPQAPAEQGSQQEGAGSTQIVTVSVLFVMSGSFSWPVTAAVFVTRPGLVALARTTSVAVAPSARSPTAQ